MFHIFKKAQGFTLLEVIIAIFVITVGTMGILVVSQDSMRIISISSSRLTAAYLAKEGMEIVRNIRDNNWLRGAVWNTGLSSGVYEAQHDSPSLTPWGGSLEFLNIDTAGFYSYATSTQTKFKRKIITTSTVDVIEVGVEVIWTERGRSYEFLVEEKLYNWR